MSPIKLLTYLAIWALIAVAAGSFLPGLPTIFEPRTGLFVLGLPWLISSAGSGPSEVFAALRDALSKGSADLPHDRRQRSASTLRRLGSMSLSTGLLAFFASSIAAFNALAHAGGQASSMDLVVSVPPALLAPLFGYFLSAFVYEPLAASLESIDSGLGLELLDC